jgi:hypothetical protein
MKKLKNLWVENRVIFVLFLIVIVCVFIILGVCINYFFGSSKSSYGDRLEGITEVEMTDEIKNKFLDTMKNDALIDDATIKSRGKVVYVTLTFVDDVTLVEAESKALASLMVFEQSYIDFYDFNYTLVGNKTESSDGFLIMGAKNVNGSGLVWNNNTEVKTDGE